MLTLGQKKRYRLGLAAHRFCKIPFPIFLRSRHWHVIGTLTRPSMKSLVLPSSRTPAGRNSNNVTHSEENLQRIVASNHYYSKCCFNRFICKFPQCIVNPVAMLPLGVLALNKSSTELAPFVLLNLNTGAVLL